MPSRDRAEYMRDYRRRDRVIETPEAPAMEQVVRIEDKDDIIATQAEEIRKLKRLLAARPAIPELTTAISEGTGPIGRGVRQRGIPVDADSTDRFNTRGFTPVPKTGKKK